MSEGLSPNRTGREASSSTSRATLSVIVVAMNEAHDIRDCLESVRGLALETIVFDSGSTDGTPDICRALGARVFETDWPGDGPQKNRALAEARGDWVICLDADERLSPELRAEIETLLAQGSPHAAFSTPRRSSFCGRFMKHSGWWPDRIVRLFRRGSARFTDVRTHTHLEIDGTTGRFDGPFIHISMPDLHEALDKTNVYSSEGALTMAENGKRSSLAKALGKGFWAFFRTWVIRAGFLDGAEGLMLAINNAETTYYRYAKLALLTRDGKVAKKR
ncbi:glycosyltransferase family 2 protein [Paraburkholderia sp. Ac-20347]|jgi:glycosyltransferase involved in cell wall biosynthesis|uniref:glycosyltransferase family 2 protein n=1 Tax=Paraburkholderia sp. Ac-20347 TaxID=2703892 RepID=UPI00198030B9|nr:glycosyltransferase family 2 protein [Paraburkholderia sp. Ac-20347]MBN3810583.1 glycosyltransferase family 2 protein [Paraburkholderia sp. Ac-20347]